MIMLKHRMVLLTNSHKTLKIRLDKIELNYMKVKTNLFPTETELYLRYTNIRIIKAFHKH